MAVNPYFSQGTKNEQYLIEDIIIESLKIYGQNMFYIPRTLVSKDEILGEDRLSKFTSQFPIEMYFENVDSFDGQGAFIQKFGLMMEQSATLVVARRRWDQLVGRYGKTIIPTRPNEGDLIYFPLTKGLFEVKFVKHQDPFYQLGKLYVYKLQVELFQYSSEHIDTGIREIDTFETLKTFSTNTTRNNTGGVVKIDMIDGGFGYTSATVQLTSTTGRGATATANIEDGVVDSIIVTNVGTGYQTPPTVTINGDGVGAVAEASIDINIDRAESYGDNNSFKRQAQGVVLAEPNPFGELTPLPVGTSAAAAISYTADSLSITADSTTITTDRA